ncbi:MAG: SH3 domain-containing protein [Bacteroidales bacterium]|nr:SH3 domain-containing protein [Bacteroidales bacterium]
MNRVVLLVLVLLCVTLDAFSAPQVKRADTYPWLVEARTNLNIRSGPGTEYNKIGMFDKGAKFYALNQRTSYWIEIQYNGQRAFVSSEYIEFLYQVTPQSVYGGKEQKPHGSIASFFSSVWGVVKVILIIIVILIVLAFKEEIAAFVAAILVFAGIGALLFWLLFNNASLGGTIGAIIGVLMGLRTVVDFEIVGGILLYVLASGYFIISFPFYVLNQLQFFLSEPWRNAFKYDYSSEKRKPALRSTLEILKILLYILITPLRLLNAVYYNIIVHGLVVIYDLFMAVMVPCNEKEGKGSFWLWLFMLPWRVVRYLVIHGALSIIECVVWTIIDVFVPAITLYHGTDLTAGQSIVGSRKRNKSLSWKSGTFTASQSNWGGIGVYFASSRQVALRYANDPYRLSDSNPVVIVCRVSPGRIINYALAPYQVYRAAGQDGNPSTLNSYGQKNHYTTGEWWNGRGGYWEYCLFDWKNLYNNRWRIRPLYIYNDRTHFIQHIKGGMAHWTFNI